jgi:hypothetical protein
MTTKRIDSVVCAESYVCGGTKSLYAICQWLSTVGRSSIRLDPGLPLASFFSHRCQLYDGSYHPDVLIYPESYQPRWPQARRHVCAALGKYRDIEPHADLTVGKSPEIARWVKAHQPSMPVKVIQPSIERATFEYDGRPKREMICYMTRHHKHPWTALLLKRRYGDRVVEIVDRSEAEVAEILRSAKVFVWRGNDKEGSPRPPKEALVAGCVVVGLEDDLHPKYFTDFGVKCANLAQLLEMAGEALTMPIPSAQERAAVRDGNDEMQDWIHLVREMA